MSSLVFLPAALCWWAQKKNNNNNNKEICIGHKVVTSEALGPGSVLVSGERRESLGEKEKDQLNGYRVQLKPINFESVDRHF